MNFKKGKENFRSKIFVNSQQAHDLSALSEEYCAIFCHPDNNNLNQYQYQYHHQPHQYSNPHQHQLQELSYKSSQTQMSLHLSLIIAVSKYKQHQTKAKINQMKKNENFDKLFVVPFLLLLDQVSTKSFFCCNNLQMQEKVTTSNVSTFFCFLGVGRRIESITIFYIIFLYSKNGMMIF